MTHRLLAINFGGIGDEVLFLPVLKSIKDAHPDWHITLLVEPRSKAIKDITDLIDEIEQFDIKKQPFLLNDCLRICYILRSGRYQSVISSGSSPLVACLLFLSGIKQRIGFYSGPLSHFLLTNAVKLNKNQYAANMYHDLVQGLGLNAKPVIPKVQVPATNMVSMQNLLLGQCGANKKTKIVIHPGTSKLAIAKGIIKTWPAANWAALVNKLTQNKQIEVILAGGPDDEQTIQEITEALKLIGSSVISFYGLTKSLADLAALISLSDLLICVDSAPMHIAVGLDKQLLAIFGPTNPTYLLPKAPQFKYVRMAPVDSNLDEDAVKRAAAALIENEVLPAVENLLPQMTNQ